jgi:hypothetical protein
VPESGQPIDRPAVYRGLTLAFAVWAAHFVVAYGAALILPGVSAARWIAIGATVIAAGVIAVAALRYRAQTTPLGPAAAALALAAILFGTLPAVIG